MVKTPTDQVITLIESMYPDDQPVEPETDDDTIWHIEDIIIFCQLESALISQFIKNIYYWKNEKSYSVTSTTTDLLVQASSIRKMQSLRTHFPLDFNSQKFL